jgi:hypothetical protein
VPLAVAAIGASILAIAGSGVYATLSAIAEPADPTEVTSGTLLLELDDDGDGLTAEVSDLAPGDTVDRFVDLNNTGTLDGEDLALELATAGDAELIDDGVSPVTTRALTLALDTCTVAWDVAASTCSGTSSSLLAATTVGALDDTTVTALGLAVANGETVHLRLRLVLPDQDETSTNGVLPATTIQDAAATLTLTFRLEQRTALETSS